MLATVLPLTNLFFTKSTVWLIMLLAIARATSVSAADHCTIAYDVEASLQVTDTYLDKGNTTATGLRGSLVLTYSLDRDGAVGDGKVEVLHFAMFESFKINAIVDVTSTIHHYAPTCNGVSAPTWRRSSDPEFPKACRYTGNDKAVAVGKLSRAEGTIEWARCKAPQSYWAKDRESYTPDEESKGRGCLSEMHVAGNIHCDGRLACKFGDLDPGDNPQFDVWAQPMIHGPPGSRGMVFVSADLATVRTPTGRQDGYQSYQLPNDAPSRTWFSWMATRDDSSRFTTCP